MPYNVSVLRDRADLSNNANYEFFMGDFIPKQRHYSEMNQHQQAWFRQDVQQYYYQHLNLNDNLVDKHPRILELVSEWIRNQEAAAYLSEISRFITNAHRDPIKRDVVTLPQDIRNGNQEVVNQFDQEQYELLEMIKVYTQITHATPMQLEF